MIASRPVISDAVPRQVTRDITGVTFLYRATATWRIQLVQQKFQDKLPNVTALIELLEPA